MPYNLDHWYDEDLKNEYCKQRTLLDKALDIQENEFCAECSFDATIQSTLSMMRIIKEELIKRKINVKTFN